DGLKDIPRHSAEPLAEASVQSKQVIERLAAALTELLDRSGGAIASQLDRVATAAQSTGQALDSLDVHLKSMHTPENIIEIKLQPFIRGFTKAVKENSAENKEQIQQLGQIIANFDGAIRILSNQLSAALQHTQHDQKQIIELISNNDHKANET